MPLIAKGEVAPLAEGMVDLARMRRRKKKGGGAW